MSGLLDEMAAGLADGSARRRQAGGWAGPARWRARSGGWTRPCARPRRAQLSPLSLRLPAERASLGDGLETLEHAAITVRGLARSMADLARLGEDHSSLHEPEERERLAGVLRELSAAVRDYGRLVTHYDGIGRELAESDLREHLDTARNEQDRLSLVLAADPAERPVGWPLRGELVSHIDRLRSELEPGPAVRSRRGRIRSWRVPPLVLAGSSTSCRRRAAADRQAGSRRAS